MMQTELQIRKNYAEVGEIISQELAEKFVTDYQETFSPANDFFVVGKNVMMQILSQPGCAGMRFYKALNEFGQETLVYLGIDANGNKLTEYSVVNENGALTSVTALVGDRSGVGTGKGL
ncbi:MAG: hypothetical protein JST87_19355 [Bacteroidetes bacterium]|nr:hypothetical protein [Bacteroidota bacterium]